ncbi:hypothetical protein ACN08Y_07910 [Rothia sp. P5764]|uniref:hypothetical protein n=1 Tax=unclassified Rothia (in: high G+C Gram-positive bacteria) TaxID=2689056 RepID=UPI003AC23772
MKRTLATSLIIASSMLLSACHNEPEAQPAPSHISQDVVQEDEGQEEPDLYAQYAIKDGQISSTNLVGQDGAVDREDKIIWEKIIQIIPPQYLSMISTYEVVTDGKDGVLASVNLNEDLTTWTISVDLDDTLNKNQQLTPSSTVTIIHEMAHIIALNSQQMSSEENQDTAHAVQEGTLKKDSYLSAFYDKFWKDHPGISQKDSGIGANRIDSYQGSFDQRPDDFITEYAAENPVEDLAESFAYFVVLDRPEDDSLKSQKLSFFYNYPELVKVRDDIRAKNDLTQMAGELAELKSGHRL